MVLLQNHNNGDPDETPRFSADFDSACSTPFVSAPSSPGRGGPPTAGYFFSAPASPMHFVLSAAPSSSTCPSDDFIWSHHQSDKAANEFEFSSRFSSCGSVTVGSMSSADELFLNGKIRPMKLSSHLQRPQVLAPLMDLEAEEDGEEEGDGIVSVRRGRDMKLRSRSLHRKARSLSPLRNADFEWPTDDISKDEEVLELAKDYGEVKPDESALSAETTPSCSASSSRSSSYGRNSKKWIFLKDLLYRSKSEGRGNGKEKFWSSISFSPSSSKEKKLTEKEKSLPSISTDLTSERKKQKHKTTEGKQTPAKKSVPMGKPANGVGKRRVPLSAHELHYTTNRAQAEEMKKRTYLPYRQGLFGCLGFSSKGYGALNGLAKTLNPVSSR